MGFSSGRRVKFAAVEQDI